jgi:hypothetical protein
MKGAASSAATFSIRPSISKEREATIARRRQMGVPVHRSVRRLQVSEGQIDLTAIANADPGGEWRIVSESSQQSRSLAQNPSVFSHQSVHSAAATPGAAAAAAAGWAGGAAMLDAPAVASEATASAYEGASAAAVTVSEAP